MDRRDARASFLRLCGQLPHRRQLGIIMDVKASHAIRQAEVGVAKLMIERTEGRFEIKPTYLATDTAYGSADIASDRQGTSARSLRHRSREAPRSLDTAGRPQR
jgi:hypothetical protein